MSDDLFEVIHKKLGCLYLSDMKNAEYRLEVLDIIRGLNPDDYTLFEWNDLIHYLTQSNIGFETQSEAREYLISRILR